MILSYEEWRAKYTVSTSDSVIHDLKEFHNIDAMTEVESALRSEYQYYLEQLFANNKIVGK